MISEVLGHLSLTAAVWLVTRTFSGSTVQFICIVPAVCQFVAASQVELRIVCSNQLFIDEPFYQPFGGRLVH